MSAERKAQLTEQLKKAREISRAKRGATAKEKKLKKLKEIESEVENNMVENIKKKVLKETGIGQSPPLQPEQVNSPEVKEIGTPAEDLETRLEKKLRMKIENEYEHKLKDYKISALQERLNDYKQTKKMKVIEEEEEMKPEPEQKVVIPDNISPLRNKSLMDKYRKIRSRHN